MKKNTSSLTRKKSLVSGLDGSLENHIWNSSLILKEPTLCKMALPPLETGTRLGCLPVPLGKAKWLLITFFFF